MKDRLLGCGEATQGGTISEVCQQSAYKVHPILSLSSVSTIEEMTSSVIKHCLKPNFLERSSKL